MINYSITARAVNPNLFEINQAKTRINQAKAEGKQPDAKDVALVETVVTNYFATAQYTEVMGIEKFARHIADHGTTYSRADIMAILYMAVDCMREQLLEGKKIRLGELGDFSVALSSKGAETAEKFSSQNIQRVTVCWEPGSEFRNLLADAEFNLVATRSAQAAVLKAIKEGKTNVDISAPINPDGSPSNPGNPSNPGSPSNPGGTTQPKKHTLTVRSANESQGSVSGGGTFDEGSTQTVQATPKTGFAFDKWSDGSTQNPRTVKLTSDLTLTASFKTATTGGGDQGSGGDQGGGTLGD
ncbi:MAG: HU family DNA-binding protein [Prevotella sp.]